jgi:DNA-binding NarL/FixJ family response regulator
MEDPMDNENDKHVPQLLRRSGLLSDLDALRAYLQKTGRDNVSDLLAILLIIHLKSLGTRQREPSDNEKHLKEVEFAYKYQLSQDHVITLKLMAQGLTYDQIAQKLKTISPDGVKKRVRRIFEQLNVHTKLEACARAREEGII